MQSRFSIIAVVTILSFLVLGSLGSVLQERDMDETKLDEIKKNHDDFRNAYMISIDIQEIDNVQATNKVFVRFFQQNDSLVMPINYTGNGPFNFLFDDEFFHLGLNQKAEEVNSSESIGFYLISNDTQQVIAAFNLSQIFADKFPNTSNEDPFKLWPTVTSPFEVVVDGIIVSGLVKYEGVLDVFGLDVHWPLWKVLTVFLSAKLGVSFFLALFDWCCQPLHRVSSWSKFKIFFGNFTWLFFGGLLTGLSYWLGGIILMLTCIFAPFGLKLVRLGVFTLFPFGREIRCDEDAQRSEMCTFIGNILWLIFIGFPIVVVHVILGIVLCVLLITIPFGLQHFKLAKIALMPFGHSVVFREDLSGNDPWERAPLTQSQQQGPRYV